MKKATSTTTLEPAEETTGKKAAHSGGPQQDKIFI